MRSFQFSVLTMLAWPLACGTHDLNETDAEPVQTVNASSVQSCATPPRHGLRVETFNAALAPNFAPLVEERTRPVLQALGREAEQLDVLCVQEFWQDADFAKLAARSRSSLPNALRRSPRPGTGTCTLDELTLLGQCLATNCAGATGADQVLCAQSQCSEVVGGLSGGCVGCIMNNVGTDFSICMGPGGPADPAIYGGAYDVGLLTRNTILDSDVSKELDSYFVRMAVLYAKLEVPDGSPVHVFCTHLGSSLGLVRYAGKFASWRDEHLHQIQELRDYIQSKAGDSERVLVMGDMNTSPDGRGLAGEWEENYAALVGNDLNDVYLHQHNTDCTWCPENTLVDDNSEPHLEDHILLRGFGPNDAHVRRTLDRPTEMAKSGATFATNLSDHYGLRGVIRTNDH